MHYQFEVWHAVNQGEFTQRGIIHYNPESSKKKAAYYENLREIEHLESIKSFEATYSDLYRLQLRSGANANSFNVSARLCQLKASALQEQFTIHLDQAGSVFHVDYVVPAIQCDKKAVPAKATFKAQVLISRTAEGARPKLQQIMADTKDGKPQPEQTFFQKYWWYMIPIIMVLLLGGGDEPAPGKGGAAKK
ncbi:hypothetical protein HDV05_004708 [Chytridiales sp. JEL 0842]|nr:hypothetical protein HDV05_004708 [Chytridiales sp. JEL 0842]